MTRIILLSMLVFGSSSIFAAESVCKPDADLSGMIQTLRATGGEVGRDSANIIVGYMTERVALCKRLDAQVEIVAGLRDQVGLLRGLVIGQQDDARQYREIIREATRAALPSRLSTGWVAGGGLCKSAGGDTDLCVGVMWGLVF